MTLLRGFLQPAQHCNDVRVPGLRQQPLVHLAIGNLGRHPCLAGELQTGVTLDLAGPGVGGYLQSVAFEKAEQRLDMARLGIYGC